MNGVTFSQNKDYIIIKIPKKQVVRGNIKAGEKELSEEQALTLFIKGKQEFKQGKLEPIQDLAQLKNCPEIFNNQQSCIVFL